MFHAESIWYRLYPLIYLTLIIILHVHICFIARFNWNRRSYFCFELKKDSIKCTSTHFKLCRLKPFIHYADLHRDWSPMTPKHDWIWNLYLIASMSSNKPWSYDVTVFQIWLGVDFRKLDSNIIKASIIQGFIFINSSWIKTYDGPSLMVL